MAKLTPPQIAMLWKIGDPCDVLGRETKELQSTTFGVLMRLGFVTQSTAVNGKIRAALTLEGRRVIQELEPQRFQQGNDLAKVFDGL